MRSVRKLASFVSRAIAWHGPEAHVTKAFNKLMSSQRTVRLITLCLLLCAIVAGAIFLFCTPRGREIMSDPRTIGPDLLRWVTHHPIHAGMTFFALYILLSLLALPVWSLQMFSGYVLSRLIGPIQGLLLALLICQITATISAIVTFSFSRWLAADWFHQKIEGRIQKIKSLDQKLGHNGFLLVMAVRLIHVMPFALSNYAFGLLRITPADIAVGTFLGGIPGVLLYVVSGIHLRLLRDWRFITAYMILNLVLLVPVALRYLKPQWFKKIGVE
jgi:uncharacterized membrane protein YdjX (TVP38/TMEM64 family)